jgi:hypothetical protein
LSDLANARKALDRARDACARSRTRVAGLERALQRGQLARETNLYNIVAEIGYARRSYVQDLADLEGWKRICTALSTGYLPPARRSGPIKLGIGR